MPAAGGKILSLFIVNLRTRDHKMMRQEHCQLSLASASDEAHEKDLLGIATISLSMRVMQLLAPMDTQS